MTFSPRRLAVTLIERYQAGGGGRHYFAVDCNFEPTCSEFTRQAIIDRGLWRGGRMGWRRIRRCTRQGLTEKIVDPYLPSSPTSEAPACSKPYS